jgi:Restriction endonuclease
MNLNPKSLTTATICKSVRSKHGEETAEEEIREEAKAPVAGIELEHVVLHLQQLMGPDASAEHNQKIKDRLGHERQVDVLIRGKFGGWPTIGVIECKDQSRKKGLNDIEAFAKKTEHLGVGLRLMVAKKGFTKTALKLAKHEHIHCLSLLQHDSHTFGIEIGEWFYGVISKWVDYRLTVTFADPAQKTELFAANEVLWQGKPVFNWFWREFVTTYRDRTRDGDIIINVSFDQVTNLEIHGQHYPVNALSCSAKGVFMKKRKWVTYSGQAFFDWHTGKVTIPPGVKVDTRPITEDLFLWDDYDGEIPAIKDVTDTRLLRAVMMLTDFMPADAPIPDLEQLSSGTRKDERAVVPPSPKGFDPYSPLLNQVIEEAGKSNPSPTESGKKPPGV